MGKNSDENRKRFKEMERKMEERIHSVEKRINEIEESREKEGQKFNDIKGGRGDDEK